MAAKKAGKAITIRVARAFSPPMEIKDSNGKIWHRLRAGQVLKTTTDQLALVPASVYTEVKPKPKAKKKEVALADQ